MPKRSNRRRRQTYYEPAKEAVVERAILVGVHFGASQTGAQGDWADLPELGRLATTAGATIVGELEQRLNRPNVRSLLGAGKVEQLKLLVGECQANLVLFDNDLSPAQGRNLERALGCRVIDRTELILDIFARHARTRQSRLQVELAQYEYMLPRLARLWKHLERQAGGIGTRGPGETQIETDRRLIRRRISQLRRELRTIDRQMETQHKQRQTVFRIALVGYTNAGKSSIMNRVSDAGVYVEDQLFATLDATTRRVETADGRQFLLTDTVGFIRKLPHHLVESFRATLSEVLEADLLLHVVDAAAEDPSGTIESVDEVLKSVGAGDKPIRFVFNKMDLLDSQERVDRLQLLYPDADFVSAQTGDGFQALFAAIDHRLRAEERQLILRLPTTAQQSIARLHELGRVDDIRYENGAAEVRLRVDGPNFGRVLQLDGVELLETMRQR